jgi:hypothetical protein
MAANKDKSTETPVLYQQCCLVYDKMLKESEPYGDGELYIWEGSLTHLFNKLGLGISRYTTVTKHLQKMGSMEQKQRGGGPVPSQWILVKAPDLETFEWAKQKIKYEESQMDPTAQRLQDLNRRVTNLEDAVFSSSEEELVDAGQT